MKKLDTYPDGTRVFYCPGCKNHHGVNIPGGAQWEITGPVDCPTIRPSILVRGFQNPPGDPEDWPKNPDGSYQLGPDGKILGGKNMRCHSFITDGQIQFLSDCAHELAGKTVPMVDIDK